MSAKIILRDKALKSIERRHPWIFSGAIKTVKGNPEDGDIVKLTAPNGQFAARGYWNSQSQIRVRILSWDAEELIDESFWTGRLQRAIGARGELTACRLVHAESDYLPGLIVDRYGDWLVLQALTLGIERRMIMLAELLAKITGVRGVYERSDVDIRRKEGLEGATGVLWGDEPPELIEIDENSHRFLVDIRGGQKTGFYLDQRENRALLQQHLSQLRERGQVTVLNAFSYTGGFTVAALAAGIGQVVSVDSSENTIELAARNAVLNDLPDADYVVGDVFGVLRQYRAEGRQFDCIILDPPKFARHARQVESATRGYKDINWLAFQLLKPGGWLWTFSCSNAIHADLFQKVVFGAMIDAGRDGQIVRRLAAAPDHPVALTFPEGNYLKGLVCRVW